MAVLIGDKSNVQFSNIKQASILMNNKIAAAPYTLDDNGNIVNNIPVINSIDIDWNNVIADEITTPIKSTADLIHVISDSKVNIKLNKEALSNIQTQLNDINEALDDINDTIINNEEIQNIKNQITNINSSIESLETNNTSINESLVNLSNSISSLNSSIPRFISDLSDGYDVLRRSSFESIKDELTGKSAYEIAKEIAEENNQPFNYANEREWIASLKGDKGNAGASAYDIARQTALIQGKEFPFNNEAEWIEYIESGINAKSYTDEQIQILSTSLTNSLNEIIDGAPEAFDTLNEVSNWIDSHSSSVEVMTSDINNRINSILGNVTEEIIDPNTHETITRVKQFTNVSGSLNGEDWATSIEGINELLNRVSFASNVQDNAEANKIDEVDFALQDFSELTGNNNDNAIKFGESTLTNKNVGISINTDLVKNIHQHTLNVAAQDASAKANNALESAKEYVNERLTLQIM